MQHLHVAVGRLAGPSDKPPQDRGFRLVMQKLAALMGLLLILAGCAFPGVYKINVQQGNILGDKELSQLQIGMTRREVQFVLGTPSVAQNMDPNVDHYLYTFQRQGGETQRQQVSAYFENDRLTRYETQLLPETPAY